jgi:UDP:flavonoid glycosyltransferase YjiC (YdhE family)
MKAVLTSRGSRGDVNPIIEIAGGLKKKGHEASICVPELFEEYALEQDVDVSLYKEDSQEIMQGLGSGLRSVKTGMKFFQNSIDQQFEFMLNATGNADILITTVNELSAPTIAEYRRIPHFRLTFAPILPGNHPPPFSPWQKLPAFLNRVGWKTLNILSGMAIKKFINKKRKELGLKSAPDSNTYHTSRSHTLLSINPELAPPCETWEGKYNYDYVGYCYGQIDGNLNQDLIQFIENGAPPVYVGFGSVHIKDPEKFTEKVVEAVEKTGCRVVLGQGWVGLGNGYLQDDIFCVGDTHHASLFPKMAGIVHHGGSGTTHTSAKAGIPQFILPQFMDQYYWGHRVHEMGMGPKPIIPKRIKSENLVRAFDELTNGMYRKNTTLLAERMKNEDGVKRSIDIILKNLGI